MHGGAELIAHHALGVADAGGGIHRKAIGQGMQHRPPLLGAARGGRLEHAPGVLLGHRPTPETHIAVEEVGAKPPARHIDDHAFDLHPRHALGGVDGQTDGVFSLFHVDDGAALHAARTLMADAQDAAAMGAPAQHVRGVRRHEARDQTGDLGGADIENREDGGLARRDRLHARGYIARHVGAPFFLRGMASARAAAASSVRRA